MRSMAVIAALATATFSIIYSGTVIAPLVTQMAAEFGTTAGTIGVVAAAYSLPGIFTGALAGPFSDRYGRRLFLVGGAAIVGTGTVLSAFAPDLVTLTVLRCAAGIGAAVVLPNMMATIADQFAPARRARIISVIFMANTLGGLAGITASGIVAEHWGWRVALALAGVVSLIAATAAAFAPLNPHVSTGAPFLVPLRRILTDRGGLALLASNYFGAVALQTWAFYIVVFFEREHGRARDVASTYALVQGIGMLIGTQLGPNAQSRLGARTTLAASLVGYGLVILGVTTLGLPIARAVAAALAAAVLYGLRATANAVLMTEQVPDARSTMFGLSQTTVAAANATAASAGGIGLDALGFSAIGTIALTGAVLSAGLVIGLVREVTTRVPVVDTDAAAVIPPA